MKDGYLIEYRQCSLYWLDDSRNQKKRALISKGLLADMLLSRKYIVYNAFLVDMKEYRLNYTEKPVGTITTV